VRGALAQAPALRGADIDVDVYNSAVTLRGETESRAQTRTAVETARSVFGVESVTERLR
jgi:osmotically-inducible protein OsmY